jgi:hypothetical protein
LALLLDLPAARVPPSPPALFCSTGEDAIQTYRELFAKLTASKPALDIDLRDANAISAVEARLSELERNASHTEAAADLDRHRRALWEH